LIMTEINANPAKCNSIRSHLPNRRASELFRFEHSGISYTATISRFGDDRLAEIFVDHLRPNYLLPSTMTRPACEPLLQCHATAIRHSISGPLATALDLITEVHHDARIRPCRAMRTAVLRARLIASGRTIGIALKTK
jgi:hypothetical protein